jgi:hypothetical protein
MKNMFFKLISILLIVSTINSTEKSNLKFSQEKSKKFAQTILNGMENGKIKKFKELLEIIKSGVIDSEININYALDNLWTPLNCVIGTNGYNEEQRFEIFKELLKSHNINVNLPLRNPALDVFATNYHLFGKYSSQVLKKLLEKDAQPTEYFENIVHSNPELQSIYSKIIEELSISQPPIAPEAPKPQILNN